MRTWHALILLAAQPAWASEGAPVGAGSCGTAELCGAPETTRGSNLLQSRQLLGKGAATAAALEEPPELEAPKEPERASALGRPDEPTPEYRGCAAAEERLAEALEHGAPAVSALEANATRGGAVFPCPKSCQWCSTSKQSHDVVTKMNVKYGEAVNRRTQRTESLLLDIYEVPSNVVKPVLVVIHGGGYSETSVKTGNWAPHVARLLARHGFLAVSIEYRRYGLCIECYKIKPNPVLEHPTLDAKAAVRWIRRNAAALMADPDRIAAFGCSAGGAITAHLLMFDWGEGSSGNPGYSSEVQAGIALSAAPECTYRRKTACASVPPYLDFHNQVDDLVPYSRAVDAKSYLDSIGATNALITLPGKGHCPDVFGPARFEDFMGFLTRHLQLPGASCPRADHGCRKVGPPAPVPPTPPPTPAPPAVCPALCTPPSCRRFCGSAGVWRDGRCTGYCNAYMGKRWCGKHGRRGSRNSVDCSPCKAAAAPSAPAPRRFFRAVDGGHGRRCQGAGAATHAGQKDTYRCRELCQAWAGCTGVGFQSSSGLCDVFTDPIRASQASPGWSCYRYA